MIGKAGDLQKKGRQHNGSYYHRNHGNSQTQLSELP